MNRKIYDLIPDATVLGSILLAYFLDRVFPIVDIVPYPVNLVGWLIVVMGIGIIMRVLSTLKSKHTSLDPAGMPSVFIRNGLYSFSRNPLYFSYVLILIGTAFIFGSLTAFVAPLICFVMLHLIIIPTEEKNMQKQFGQKYELYKHLVRRWI